MTEAEFQVFAASMLLLAAAATWLLARRARAVPPVLTHPRIASGAGGLLLVFAYGTVLQLLMGAWNLWSLLPAVSDALTLLRSGSDVAAKTAFMAAVPTAAALVLEGMILAQALFGRRASAAASVIVMLWLAGPGVTMLQSWYFHLELAPAGTAQIFGWPILWTAWFAVSRRAALTYGTARGRRIAQGLDSGRFF